jgi:hypothetical protein
MTILETVRKFAESAAANATRFALHQAEALPELEGVLIIVNPEDDSLLGARVYFVPPVKVVWMTPDYSMIYNSYSQAIQTQSPLTARFYLFTGSNFDDAVIYENPAA